jgi:hypothetical protein
LFFIQGANNSTYNPQPGDSGKYLIFKVTPAAASGNSPGSTWTSAATGPATEDSTVTVFGSISSEEEVDEYTIRLNTSTDVTIDVESNEGSHEGWNNIGGLNFPTDLGFLDGEPTNGPGNDLLTSNIYFFTSGGAALDFRVGTELCNACSSCHFSGSKSQPTPGFPGCDAPNAFTTRNPKNPYLDMTALSAGDYFLAIGSQYLSETDAWSGTNNGPDISGWTDPGSGFNNYKITFIFN